MRERRLSMTAADRNGGYPEGQGEVAFYRDFLLLPVRMADSPDDRLFGQPPFQS